MQNLPLWFSSHCLLLHFKLLHCFSFPALRGRVTLLPGNFCSQHHGDEAVDTCLVLLRTMCSYAGNQCTVTSNCYPFGKAGRIQFDTGNTECDLVPCHVQRGKVDDLVFYFIHLKNISYFTNELNRMRKALCRWNTASLEARLLRFPCLSQTSIMVLDYMHECPELKARGTDCPSCQTRNWMKYFYLMSAN